MIHLIVQGVVTYFIVRWLFRKLEQQLGCSVGDRNGGSSNDESPAHCLPVRCKTEQPRYRSNLIEFGRKHG